ncbi:uncharacterized protein LOC119733437 [Patiria miniata]|uniref:CCHC-type domain-containing protein n=1 Tax=Patiria miniata TaxID=46514 RepID=A0A914AHM2_PATMI|nr:uncharacterized protein LOC119733365 [Patiria miniata]XP_038062892.1 uncharacterized protein LOC119733384 [Patiria miniata]XP_038062933.1 uncharacterized protein LOC119733437 [Patiria miniata]
MADVWHKDKALEVRFEDVTSAKSVFDKFKGIGIEAAQHLSAMQPLQGNKFEVVFKTAQVCKEFYPKVADIDGCTVTKFNDIVIVTVHYVSMAIHDSIVRNILGKFGQVLAGRFTTYGDNPTVFNGTRQYRMKVTSAIPTVIRIGDRNAWISYPGQVRTCARCGQQGHYARDCNNIKCFKCLQVGHVANECPNSTKCTICEEEGHGFRACPKSFARKVQPERGWSKSTTAPPPPPPPQPAGERLSVSEADEQQLPAKECPKCKKMSGPFHSSIVCFSCKGSLLPESFRVLECALCKGTNGPPSLVCDRNICRQVVAPAQDDGFRVVRKRKGSAKRTRSPPDAPASKKPAPSASDLFGSSDSSMEQDQVKPKGKKAVSSSGSSYSSSSSSGSSSDSSDVESEGDSTANEVDGVDPVKTEKCTKHISSLNLPGISKPARCKVSSCSFTCPAWSGLVRHASSVHKDTTLTQLKCPWCKFKAYTPGRWSRHICRRHAADAILKQAGFFKKFI